MLDLQNPKLRLLAASLAGGSWRIGGTHGDSIVYVLPEGGGPAAETCRTARAPRCYPICLRMERWQEIVRFSQEAGLKLVFGLNMQTTDTTNLLAFLNYTAAHALAVDTFELGNELGIKGVLSNGPAIRAAVDRLWPALRRPLLAGPDDAGDGDANETEFRTLLGALKGTGTLDVLTYHAYCFHNGGGGTPQLIEHMLNTSMLNGGTDVYANVLRAAHETLPGGVEVWMGEGNSAGYGGRRGVTNTFRFR